MNTLARLATLLLALLLLAGCGEPARLEPLPADAVVLAFGDSLTAGSGAGEASAYPAVLETLIDRRVINAGVPGEESAEGRERLPSLLARHRPGLLILCHGGNDLLRKRGKQQLADNLEAMIATARERGIGVVLVGVPKPGVLLDDAELYRDVAESTGVVYEGDALESILSDRDLKSDTIHPNAAGYRRLAEAIAAKLREAGAIGPAGR